MRSPYREPAAAPPPPPRPRPEGCAGCRREGVRVGRLVMVSGTYGAGDEVWRYRCGECGDVWD